MLELARDMQKSAAISSSKATLSAAVPNGFGDGQFAAAGHVARSKMRCPRT
jgi:hypothetical protein